MSSVSPLPATPATVQSPQPIRADSTAWRITRDDAGRLEGVVGAEAAGQLEDLLDGVGPADERRRSRPGRARARAAPRRGRRRRSARRPAAGSRRPRRGRPCPAPKTTHVEPGSTFAVFIAAPSPVESPHANRHAPSSGASGVIFASAISGITVYSANVDVPMKCRIGSPSRDEPRRAVRAGSPCSAARGSPGRGSSAGCGSGRTRGTAARRASRRGRPARRASTPVADAPRRRRRPRGRAPSARSRTGRRPRPCRGRCGRRRTRRAARAPRPALGSASSTSCTTSGCAELLQHRCPDPHRRHSHRSCRSSLRRAAPTCTMER